MATIAKFTSEIKEYKNAHSGKVTYSRFILDDANNKGILETQDRGAIDAMAIGSALPTGKPHQRIQGCTGYWLKAGFRSAPVSANNATTQASNVRSGYTALDLDKLFTHYMSMFLDILKDKGVVFTEGMASIPNTWVMTATQQGVKVEDIKHEAPKPTEHFATVTTPGIPITLKDAKDKALEQAKKLKQSKPMPECSEECKFIIDACQTAAADNNETEEFALRMFSLFKDKEGKEKFIKDIDKLIELDGKGSKWIKSTYRNAKEYMSREHSEMDSQEVPEDAVPEDAVKTDNGDHDDQLPF